MTVIVEALSTSARTIAPAVVSATKVLRDLAGAMLSAAVTCCYRGLTSAAASARSLSVIEVSFVEKAVELTFSATA